MHRVLLRHIGNVQFLVLHTGTATGIRITSSLTSRSRFTRIEITPLEPDQRSYLRREAPSVLHYFLTALPLSWGRANTGLLTLFFALRLDKVGVQTSTFLGTNVPKRTVLTFCSNSTVAGISSKVSPQVSSR